MKTNSPVYTRVVNHYPIDKVLSWAGRNPIFVAANSETTVDYDIWSLASEGQRIAMKAELPKGKIELYVGVKGPQGYSETLLDILGKNNEVVTTQVGSIDTHDFYEEPAFATGLVTIPDKPVPEGETTSTEPEATITVYVPSSPAEDAIQSARSAFASHVENKEWAQALKVIKGVYGDKVTFGPRAIMTSKSWDVLVTKHRLAVED